MLHMRFLGDQDISTDGGSLAQRLGRRSVELLAYLSAHPRTKHPRQVLACLFWPESTDAQALTNLRREIHRVRSVLGASELGLEIDSHTIGWNPPESKACDVVVFLDRSRLAEEAYAAGDSTTARGPASEAVSRYQGEFMPGSHAEWILKERERLQGICVGLLDRLTEFDLREDPGSAVSWATSRVELEPVQETGYQLLMKAQLLTGDRAAALRTYHRCVSVLDRELGVQPSAVTRSQYEEISSSPSDTAAHTTDPPRPSRPRLVGRRTEVAELQARWRAAVSSRGGLYLISGDAGVGKTRLVNEFVGNHLASEVTVAWASCSARRGQPALAPIAQWLRTPDFQRRTATLDPQWRREVERLVPSESRGTDGPRLSAMADGWRRTNFREGLTRALVDPSRPTLLVVDDLHWCDDETEVWLPAFIDDVQSHPLLVLATARPEELAARPRLSALLDSLQQTDLAMETQLAPLLASETARLAGDVLGVQLTNEEEDRWQQETGGFPLFVVEVARMRHQGGPSDRERPQLVSDVLGNRLAQLPEAARLVAELAACIGHQFTVDLLCAASDLSRAVVIDAVDELWRKRILRSLDPQHYDFSHDLLREAAYEEVAPDRRTLFHRRVAQATELLHAADVDAVAGELAEQYGRADQPERAIRYHISAAHQASEVFANNDAIRHYNQGLRLLSALPASRKRDQLELKLRHAKSAPLNAEFGYSSNRLRAELERSIELAERLSDDRQLILSLAGLFAVRYVQGDIAESFDIASRSLQLIPQCPEAAGEAHFAFAGAATSLGRHAEAVPHFEAAHRLSMDQPPSVVGTRPEVHGRAWSAHALWLLGQPGDADKWSRWAISRAEETEHQYSLAVAVSYAAITHQMLGDVETAGAMSQRAREVCSRYGFAYYHEWGTIVEGWCMGGHAGIDQINEGLQSLRAQGAIARRPYYLGLLAETELAMGDVTGAARTLDTAIAAAREHSDIWWLPELLRLKGHTCSESQAKAITADAVAVAQEHGSVALLDRITAGS